MTAFKLVFLINSFLRVKGDHEGLHGPMLFTKEEMKEFEESNDITPNLNSDIDILLGLRHPDVDAIYGTLRAVSDPKSPYYGKYLSQSQVKDLVTLKESELKSIEEFFQKQLPNASISHFSNTNDHYFIRATVRDLQRIFADKIGYIGEFEDSHRGSNVLVAHKELTGDKAYESLIQELPQEIAKNIEFIQFYLPEHMYPVENEEYIELIDSGVCSMFDALVHDDSLPSGEWKSSVNAYDQMNPFTASVKPDDSEALFVLKGTRGLKDRGIIHFIPTNSDGEIKIITGEMKDEVCNLSHHDLWEQYVLPEVSHISKVELRITQDDTPTLLTFPFEKEFVTAACHERCQINEIDGTCIMFNLKFSLTPFRQTIAHARLVFDDGTVSAWTIGNGNETPFAANLVVDVPMLKRIYQMESHRLPKKTKRDSIVVTSFLEEQFDPEDTRELLIGQGLSVEDLEDRLFIVGPNNPKEGRMTGIEASLDIELIMALAPEYDVIYWNVPGRELTSGSEPFMRLMYQLSTWNEQIEKLPSIVSISYGDEEMRGIGTHLNRLDREMAKLGIMGVTVVAASGDDGSNGMKSRKMENEARCSFASPGFPATLPSVLSVGATQLSNKATPMCRHTTVVLPPMGPVDCEEVGEIGASTDGGGSLITTGGGYSYYFNRDMDMMWYQKEALEQHEKTLATSHKSLAPVPSSYYNSTGRGFPDIAIMGTNVPVVLGGKWAFLSGTSVSAPVASSVIANLRAAVGHKVGTRPVPLGFMNPLLYAIGKDYPWAFNDIVVGTNNCGYRGVECCPHGFEATTGWDPVGGLGSINVALMAEEIVALIKEYQSDLEMKGN